MERKVRTLRADDDYCHDYHCHDYHCHVSRTEYLSHYQCIKETIPELHDCMDQLVISLDEIARMPGDQRIPSACCSFSRYISCSVRPVKQKCAAYDPTAQVRPHADRD